MPCTDGASSSADQATGSYWYEFLGRERQLGTGPLWFVGVLLIISLAYVALVLSGDRVRREPGMPITTRHLLLVTATVAPTSFLVRLDAYTRRRAHPVVAPPLPHPARG